MIVFTTNLVHLVDNYMIKAIDFSRQIDSCPSFDPFLGCKNKELKINLIKEVAKKTLLELAVSLALAGFASLFMATPLGIATAFIAAVATVVMNIIFRIITVCLEYQIQRLKQSGSSAKCRTIKHFQNIQRVTNYLAPISFGLLDSQTRDVVVHEMGHSLAAHLLIKNPQTKISLNPLPLQGGQTSYRLGELTGIGKLFGKSYSKLFIAAAGPALSIITAVGTIGASIAVRNSKPELSRYLCITAIVSVAQHAFYAISAFWASRANRGHDFLQLWTGGVHPIVSVVSIVAIPIIIAVAFFIYENHLK